MGIGGSQGAMAPDVLNLDAQTEFHGFIGDEVRAQAEAFPDLEAVFGSGAGALDGSGLIDPFGAVPAGEVAVGEEVAVDQGVSGHPHLGGCLGADGGGRDQDGGQNRQQNAFHDSLLQRS